jgi:RimJ/RimL family protein N-acetyltransferase
LSIMNQPEIAAGAVLLRAWRRSDADAVVRAWTDPEIRRWGRFGVGVPDLAAIEQWVDWNHQQWQFGLRAGFAVCTADGAEVVGSIMLRDFARFTMPGRPPESGETGYWIVPEHRGRGAASAALRALAVWGFEPAEQGGLGLRRIELRHSVRNPASCRVAEKAGFRCEGTMRESCRYADGDWHDEHLHARLSTDSPVEESPVEAPRVEAPPAELPRA